MRPIVSDIVIKYIQKKYYRKFGGKANSFEPVAASEIRTLDNGVVLHNEVQFSRNFPNSFADIYYTNGDFSKKRPTIIYLHGGGFFMGSRTSGDPLASAGGGIAKQNIMLAQQGYHVVSMDYCLAPQYRYPKQLVQINEGLGFFKEHAEIYHLDMENVVIMGGSAGAVMTAMLGAIFSNPVYAKELGITPALGLSFISGLVIDGAPMNAEWFNWKVMTMFRSWMGTHSRKCKQVRQIRVSQWVTEEYPKTFLTAGNDGCFPEHVQELGDALRKKGVEVDDFYIDPAVSRQGHGYLGNWERDPYAREGMDRLLNFIRRVTKK